MNLKPLDILMGLAVPLLWGLGIVFAKAALEHFPPILLMALRFTVTALALVWFTKPPWHLMKRIFVIALISAAIQYSLTFNGLRGVDASTAVLVIQLEVPFIVLLGAIFLGWSSLFLLVSGAFTWAIGQVLVRRLGRVHSFTLIAWVAVFASPQLFAMSLVFEDDHMTYLRTAGWVVWGTVVYLGLVMTALGYTLWYSLIGRHPVGQVAPFLLLLPVFSVIGGVTILGESLTPMIAIGGGIVIAGVAFIVIERAPEPVRTEAPGDPL
jgi:O-acetylserine/cysteine efflux transporter